MNTQTKQLIDELYKKLEDATGGYEIDMYRNQIENLKNGICPTCHAQLPANHKLR